MILLSALYASSKLILRFCVLPNPICKSMISIPVTLDKDKVVLSATLKLNLSTPAPPATVSLAVTAVYAPLAANDAGVLDNEDKSASDVALNAPSVFASSQAITKPFSEPSPALPTPPPET